MQSCQVEILNPQAYLLLQNLEKMDIIKINPNAKNGTAAIEKEYAAMAADAHREADALEWSEATLNDINQ